MKNLNITPTSTISGEIRVASDKSISHRAVMLSALAEGKSETTIRNALISEDVGATINAMRACGIEISAPDKTTLLIRGGTLREPENGTIDCGNSGTLMRLFCGIAAGWNIPCRLIGDSSLMTRPMRRVIKPLQQMNAIISVEKDKPPVAIGKRSEALNSILFSNVKNSGQVKSAVLFAGLRAEGSTVVAESIPSRDHSERMLELFGASLRRSEDGRVCEITPSQLTSPGEIQVPADISSAMFFIVAAAISVGSEILLTEVGINPTRIGGLDILRQMGADIDIINERAYQNEPVADIRVRGGELHGINIKPEQIPAAIDDLPVLMIAAATARGETRISGADELRVKESDRITTMVNGLKTLGVDCSEKEDGVIINGKNGSKPSFSGGTIETEGDHRIAMAFAIASMRAKNELTIKDSANVATSFPNFSKIANTIGMRVVEEDA